MLLSNEVNQRLNKLKVQEGLSKSLIVRLSIEYSYAVYRKYMEILEKKKIDEVSDKQVIIGTCIYPDNMFEPFTKEETIKIENMIIDSNKKYRHLLIDEANNILRTDDLKEILAMADERAMAYTIVMPTIEYLLDIHPDIYNDKEILIKYIGKKDIVPPHKIAYLIERTKI